MKLYIEQKEDVYGTTYYYIKQKKWYGNELIAIARSEEKANRLFDSIMKCGAKFKSRIIRTK